MLVPVITTGLQSFNVPSSRSETAKNINKALHQHLQHQWSRKPLLVTPLVHSVEGIFKEVIFKYLQLVQLWSHTSERTCDEARSAPPGGQLSLASALIKRQETLTNEGKTTQIQLPTNSSAERCTWGEVPCCFGPRMFFFASSQLSLQLSPQSLQRRKLLTWCVSSKPVCHWVWF